MYKSVKSTRKNKQNIIKVGKQYKVKLVKGIDAEFAGTDKWE
jgi:hypothetical protein